MRHTAAVITVSDKCFRGEQADACGPAIRAMLLERGLDVCYSSIVPNEAAAIQAELIKCADELQVSLVLTAGGTGFSSQNVTPEATLAIVERETRGIPEAMRAGSMRHTPRGCLSRGVAGIRGRTLIINLPGSEKAAKESLNAVLMAIAHALDMLASDAPVKCAAKPPLVKAPLPSLDTWLREAKRGAQANGCGIFLFQHDVLRESSRDATHPQGLCLSWDLGKVEAAKEAALAMPGIAYVRVWLNDGMLSAGDDIMLVLVGGDVHAHVNSAMQALANALRQHCLTETEIPSS